MLGLLLVEGFWGLIIYLTARRMGLRPSSATIILAFSSVAPTLTVAAWGQVFAVDPTTVARPVRPKWVVDALWWFFYASIAASCAAPLLARGYRIPAALFALPQIPLTWFFGFIGTMQVTGVWL